MLLIWLITLCFRCQGIHFWHFHRAAMLAWPRKSRSTSGSASDSCVKRGYSCFDCMHFCYFVILNVFEIKESIYRSFTELPVAPNMAMFGWPRKSRSTFGFTCALKSTYDLVSWRFVISSFPTFSRSRNPVFAVSQRYHVRKTSKI